MNRWSIPEWMERKVRERDRSCVYCGSVFEVREGFRGAEATWEHIVNDLTMVTLENIALCCWSCNASKGSRPLAQWLEMDYCKRRGISNATVSAVVRRHLDQGRWGALPERAADDGRGGRDA